jgi:hypothetical protein
MNRKYKFQEEEYVLWKVAAKAFMEITQIGIRAWHRSENGNAKHEIDLYFSFFYIHIMIMTLLREFRAII